MKKFFTFSANFFFINSIITQKTIALAQYAKRVIKLSNQLAIGIA